MFVAVIWFLLFPVAKGFIQCLVRVALFFNVPYNELYITILTCKLILYFLTYASRYFLCDSLSCILLFSCLFNVTRYFLSVLCNSDIGSFYFVHKRRHCALCDRGHEYAVHRLACGASSVTLLVCLLLFFNFLVYTRYFLSVTTCNFVLFMLRFLSVNFWHFKLYVFLFHYRRPPDSCPSPLLHFQCFK